MLNISLQQVEKSYGNVKAVQNLSFTLHSGQIFALLGPNGAGKSSLIRMLVGLTRPDSGEIRVHWQQQEFSSLPEGCFGYLPEDRGLYLDKSVTDNLSYIGRLRGLSKTQLQQQLDQAQQGVAQITQSVLQLEQRYQQTHQHLTAIEQGTTDAYQQMFSIETAGQTLLKATADTQQQLSRFGHR